MLIILIPCFWASFIISTFFLAPVVEDIAPTIPPATKEEEDKLLDSEIKEGYEAHVPYGEPSYFTMGGQSFTLIKEVFEQFSSNEEEVQGFNAPISPFNEDVVYLATDQSDIMGDTTNKIYSYNKETGELNELYSESQDYQTAGRNIRILAIQGTKLILWVEPVDNSPGPCASIWCSPGAGGYQYLELSDIQNGLQKYEVPEYKQANCEADFEECMATLE